MKSQSDARCSLVRSSITAAHSKSITRELAYESIYHKPDLIVESCKKIEYNNEEGK